MIDWPAELRDYFSYDPETGVVTWAMPHYGRPAGRVVGTLSTRGYLKVKFRNKMYQVHRIAWWLGTGIRPDGEIDHINGQKADNRLANLRVVSGPENSRNKPRYSSNTSGIIGVHWAKGRQKWNAQIGHAGRRINLGYFATQDEAVAARRNAECRYEFHPNHGRIPSRNWERRS